MEKKFDRVKLDEDIKHCEDVIARLSNSNTCDECLESHKRLLSYMLFIVDLQG